MGGKVGMVQRAVAKVQMLDALFGGGKVIVDAHDIAVFAVYRQMAAFAPPCGLAAVQTGEMQAVAAAFVAYPVGAVSCGKTVGIVAGTAVEPVVAFAAAKI